MQKYQSPALDKGLDILEYLSLNDTPQSQTEIAHGTQKKPNQIYRMLVCLEERGYIEKGIVSGKYSLSLKLYYLSHRHSPINSIRKAALYPLQKLSEYSGQSCHLSILHKHHVLVIAQSLSPGPIALSIEDGGLFSLCGTTSGRIILSQLQKENQILHLMETEEFSSLSKKQQSQYLSEVETVGNNGHDIRKSETTQGVFDIAIPFSIPEININGSVTVSALTGQSQKNISNDFILNKLNSTVLNVYKNLGILPK